VNANMTEAFVSDNKRAFQKAFSDINTSTMSMRDLRKERFGAYTVERQYLGNGLYTYRVIVPKEEK